MTDPARPMAVEQVDRAIDACPHCGQHDEFDPSVSKSYKYAEPGDVATGKVGNPAAGLVDAGFYVECGECGACGSHRDTEVKAITAWNQRTDPARLSSPDREGVEKALTEDWLADRLREHDPMCGAEDCARTARGLLPDLLAALATHGGEAGAQAGEGEPFQARVQPWLMACFGAMIAGDREERNHRFLEEALELVQSLGCTASEAHQLVDYVYGRDVGEPAQEVGGVMVTVAALCLANKLDMHANGETELARIWTKVEAIRAKQAAKPKHSPLPEATPRANPTVADDGRAREVLAVEHDRQGLTEQARRIRLNDLTPSERRAVAAIQSALATSPRAGEVREALEAADDILEGYVIFLHHMPSDDLEAHPYIPVVEDAFDKVRAALAALRADDATDEVAK